MMIKKYLQGLLGKKESIELKEWRTDHSILNFLRSHLDDTGNLTDAANDLPDEKRDDDKVRFAPGLMDAMFGADNSNDSKNKIQELSNLLKKVAYKGDAFSAQEFYTIITESSGVISIIDEFLTSVVNNALPTQPYLFNFAKDLATQTDKRNAVKFGIAILGLCQNKTVLQDIKTLGLHDEFTVYATIAITYLSDHPVTDLWDLAKRVDGWGKIQLVDRLAQCELEEPIKDWLVREGYKNNIMYEYLAFTCAMHGDLHERLQAEQIDHALFLSAKDIIDALIVEHSPSEDISSYAYAASVVENFIRHAKHHTQNISVYNSLYSIKEFLTQLQNDIGQHTDNGWDQDLISNGILDLVALLNSSHWRQLAYDGLESENHFLYWNAKQGAEKLGIDLWETVWKRLQQKPLDSTAWYDVTRYAKPEHAEQIIDFALLHLPLDELSTGPKDSMGSGPHYQKYMCLDYVISFLENYPKKGEKIILAGLNCPTTRNRNIAIRVLHTWGKENWSTEMLDAINQLSIIEPNQNTKDNIERLINGEELK